MIRHKFLVLENDLDERARRRWAAVEAKALGRGGISTVARATGLSRGTGRAGLRELADPHPPASRCQRRTGGGRKPDAETQPGLRAALDRLIEPSRRGSPMSAVRWTCKGTRRLAKELRTRGLAAPASTVRRSLRRTGYSLQANRKTREGKQHPDRDGQFRHIHRRILAQKRRREPSISVDTKKKAVLGNPKDAGDSDRPKGRPIEVDGHGFPDPELGQAVPYGVCDIDRNEAGVSVGIRHDTAAFAVGAIRRWWSRLGRPRYRRARRVLATADGGGSNGSRGRLWKRELQKPADETGLILEACHSPPGTSKWNKIEHRLFCHVTRNWAGEPLETAEVVVECIARTTAETGLEVHAWLDENDYEKGQKGSDAELAECRIKRHRFHGEWNYEIHPHE